MPDWELSSSPSTHFWIGGESLATYQAGDPMAPFNGTIDDARVYSRALTATEIKQIYQLGQTSLKP